MFGKINYMKLLKALDGDMMYLHYYLEVVMEDLRNAPPYEELYSYVL